MKKYIKTVCRVIIVVLFIAHFADSKGRACIKGEMNSKQRLLHDRQNGKQRLLYDGQEQHKGFCGIA